MAENGEVKQGNLPDETGSGKDLTPTNPFDLLRHEQLSEVPQENRGARPYSPVQFLFLLRLARLLRQRQEYLNVLTPEDYRFKLLPKAIYSTYCDCLEQGIGEDAKELFDRDKAANRA